MFDPTNSNTLFVSHSGAVTVLMPVVTTVVVQLGTVVREVTVLVVMAVTNVTTVCHRLW